MNKKDDTTSQNALEAAVIGVACRFPGAENTSEFWQNLKSGIESISFFSHEELQEAGVPPQMLNNPNYVKANGMLENIQYFDATFFDYTPQEALLLNPQSRFFHECCWQALEDAGYDPGAYEGIIGLYAGSSNSTTWEVLSHLSGISAQYGEFPALLLTDKDLLHTRISYKLNLKGPSISSQTTCSTSLVAIHQAYRALLTGECKLALAGGVTINKYKKQGYLHQEDAIFSPDGHCRVFDARSKGTIGGDGAGVVVLKLLKKALRDQDHIYAVVKGSGINNDGSRKVGFTAPSIEGQAEVIKTALRMARTPPDTIGYVEAHGTGTILGDPVEINALKLAFNTSKKGFCPIGSVKTNLGHLDCAAGAAGFIKTVLALKHRIIPPSLHFESSNPNIDFENSPFYVNTKLLRWENQEHPLRAGVSSFGIGGTNAHVILEEAPEDRRQNQGRGGVSPPNQSRQYQLILLSAKTETALHQMTENLANFLKENRVNPGNPVNPGLTLADAAYTLQVGRRAFRYRKCFLCSGINEAIEELTTPGTGHGYVQPPLEKSKSKRVVFMFPGQGTQYINMGRDLYEKEPYFRQEMDRCFEILKPIMGCDIKEILYPHSDCRGGFPCPPHDDVGSPGQGDHRGSPLQSDQINQTEIAQPVIFIIEYAMAKLLIKWGIKPDAMVGHSIGEYTAACLSGVFSLADALKLVAWRGKLMQQMPPGAMLSVSLPEEEVKPYLEKDKDISLAAVNSPSLCVVSGNNQAVEALAEKLKKNGIENRRLHTSHAFHSGMMDPIVSRYKEKVTQVPVNEPQIPYISNITGKWLTGLQAADPAYWAIHLRKTVRFAEGLTELLKEDDTIFAEVGPGQVLSTLTRQQAKHIHETQTGQSKKADPVIINFMRHPREQAVDNRYLLTQIGRLWLYGQSIDWSAYYSQETRNRISLPTYPWAKERVWFEEDRLTDMAGMESRQRPGKPSLHKKKDVSNWFYIPSWKRSMLSVQTGTKQTKKNNWLIFIHEPDLGPLMVEELKHGRQPGDRVIIVKQSSAYTRVNDGEYLVNPRERNNYETLFQELKQKKCFPSKIIHLWSVSKDVKVEPGSSKKRIDDALYPGFYSLIYLARAIAKHQFSQEIQTWVITNHTQAVTGDERICPGKAAVLGPIKVISQEYPFLVCRAIDVALPQPGHRDEKKLVAGLIREINAEPVEAVIAYRNNNRWLQIFEPVHLEEVTGEIPLLKKGGTYLITGGLGNIGFTLAKHLAEKVKAKLILTGRTALPPAKEWDQWLASHDAQDPITARIKKIRELEESGAEVLAFGVDAAEFKPMQQVVSQAEKRFGQINGVIHAAGDTRSHSIVRTVAQLDETSCRQQFRPKIYGLLVLEKIFRQRQIDFCLLTSSLSSVLGGIGFAAYSAANCFMDAFVQQNHPRSPFRWTSINLGEWRFSGTKNQALALGAAGAALSMSPLEGVKAFQRILYHCDVPQVAVSSGDLQARLVQWIKLESLRNDTTTPKDNQDPTSLLSPSRPHLTTPYIPPGNTTEKKLVKIWQGIFGYRQVGVRDNFFELGGDSLKAVTVAAKIHKEFHVSIPLTEFFTRQTVQSLSQYIKDAKPDSYFAIKPVEKKEYYILSSAQYRLFLHQRMDPESTVYNEPAFFVLHGQQDKRHLEQTFFQLVERHESLRTSITLNEGTPVQRIADNPGFTVECYETGETDPEPAIERFIRPFDLKKAPLFRVTLIKLSPQNHMLVVDQHHIITDAVSVNVLLKDFLALSAGKKLPGLKLQYKDYCQWQDKLVETGELKKQEAYWLREFAGDLPVLNLPTDFPRPTVQSFDGGSVTFEFDKPVSRALRDLGLAEDATLFMVLLTLYTVFLAKLSGQEDIIVGTVSEGRMHEDLQEIIGMFVNTLTLRNYPKREKTFRVFLNEVKERTLEAFRNQDYQFEKLVKQLVVRKDASRNPLYDAGIGLQTLNRGTGSPGAPPQLEAGNTGRRGMIPPPYKYENRVSKNDLNLMGFDLGDKITFKFEYCAKLFKEETIRSFSQYFRDTVDAVIENNDIQLKDIKLAHGMLTPESKPPRIEFKF